MEGRDILEGNSGMPPWSEICDAGYWLLFHKTNESNPGSAHKADALFTQRSPELQYAGFIRGTFDLVHKNAVPLNTRP